MVASLVDLTLSNRASDLLMTAALGYRLEAACSRPMGTCMTDKPLS